MTKPMRLLQTGERGKAPVLNRPHQDMLTGSGYLADGTDFDGFATPAGVAEAKASAILAAATDTTARVEAGVMVAKDYADAGDVEIAAAAEADATEKADAAQAAAEAHANAIVAAIDTRVSSNETAIATLQVGQSTGVLGYATKAALLADLAHPAGTVGLVTNDPTPANNGSYLKSGASGAGAWAQSSFDRVALVEAKANGSEELLGAMATVDYPVTLVAETVADPGVVSLASSTFSGFGGPVGARQNFNRISFWVKSWDAADPVTQARVQVRENDYNGTLLADKTANIAAPFNVDTLVTIELDAVVGNAGNVPLYIMFWTDGKTGSHLQLQGAGIYPVPPNAAGRYSTSGSVATTQSQAYSPPDRTPYFKLQRIDYATPIAVPETAFAEATVSAAGLDGAGPRLDAVEQLTGLMATEDFEVLASATSLTESACSFQNLLSTFSGWGCAVGVRQNIDRVRLRVQCFDAADLITAVRLQIREVDSAGALLADVTVAVQTEYNVGKDVYLTLPARLVNAGGSPLWVMFWADGKTGRFGKDASTEYPVPPNPTPRYSTSNSVTDLTSTAVASGAPALYGTFFEFITLDRNAPIADPTPEFLAAVRASIPPAVVDYDANYLPALPPKIYATEGVQANIYADSVAHLETGEVVFPEFECAKGRQLDECWRITPVAADAAAVTPMTMRLRRLGDAVVTKTSSLVVTAKTAATRSVKVLCIGDSLTNAAAYTQRMLDLSGLDGNTLLTLIGTQGAGANKHEGRGGWTVARYNNEEAPGTPSPFFYGGVFNFAQYLSANALATPDLVTVFLGVNDLFSRTETGAAVTAFAEAQFAKIETWITSMRAANPAIKIGICLVPMPSRQDGFNAFGNYKRQTYLRRIFLWQRAAIAWFGNREASGIYVIPTSCCMDTRYAFPTDAAAPVFAHSTVMVERQNNHVHPAVAGYYQIGDTIWAAIKGMFS